MHHPWRGSPGSRLAPRLAPLLLAALIVVTLVPGPFAPVTRAPEALAAPLRPKTIAPGDGAGIVAALAEAKAAGGGVIYVPAGVYLLPRKLNVPSNTTLYGDGIDRTIFRWAPGAVIEDMVRNDSTNGNTNIQIRSLTLDGEYIQPGPGASSSGIRFRNVTTSYVVDVAADRHPQDGFHWSYTTRKEGVSTTRLSGCRASLNGRNGVSITQGSGNVVDRCRIEGNNLGELVAGIDLEPDQGLSVTGSKIVANLVANHPNNGIQAYVAYNGYATVTDNALCDNVITANRGTGIYDFKSGSNLYVGNATGGNGQAELYHDTSPRIGEPYRSACLLPDLPPAPGSGPGPVPPTATPAQPVPTPAATPEAACQPRPGVSVTAQRGAPGTLVATIAVSATGAAPNNQLRSIQFGPARNATLEVGGQQRGPGGFTLTPPSGTRQIQVVVHRTTPGQPVTVPLTVTDDCGSWPTFVGGGPAAF